MSAPSSLVKAVVVDIEGTVGAITHVHEVLFPYARARLVDWTVRNPGHPLLDAVRELADAPELDAAGAAEALAAWSDADVKAPPLKAVQALIWAEGYAAGELHGHLYQDVPDALRRWRDAGIGRYVYSSGARAAQHDWFAHSNLGDLTGLLDGYFDLDDAGSKKAPASYRTIGRTIGADPSQILFLSDVGEELDAAVAAGWRALGVRRPGDPRGAQIEGHPTVPDLSGV